MNEKRDSYQIVTDRIIQSLESGVVPWRKPWAAVGGPKNLLTGRLYQGFVNRLILTMSGYDSPYWVTYKQAQALGGQVRKGEKGSPATFWKVLERSNEQNPDLPPEKIFFLRHFSLFNLEQCDGLEEPAVDMPTCDHNPVEAAQQIIDHMPCRPSIIHKGQQAYYKPSSDQVVLPPVKRFISMAEYYSTAFHEPTHATGHPCRLNREKGKLFGDEKYSQEELVAELAAAYLVNQAGLLDQTVDNSAAYIQGWLKALKNDKRLLVVAAGQAQKAADFILGRTEAALALAA